MRDNTRECVIQTVIASLKPKPRIGLPEWSAKNRVLSVEGSADPGPWSNDKFPFLREIMDCLAPWHPANEITFCKSSQVGGTEIGLNWLMYLIDVEPGPTMMIHPTVNAASAWVREKFEPTLSVNPYTREMINKKTDKNGNSSSLFKKFMNGFLVITGANSSADLSSKSIRYRMDEECDRWPQDVDGQGDPAILADSRQRSYKRSGKWKTFRPSTPAIKQTSRVWAGFEAGDQRYYNVKCPHCDERQKLEFFPDSDGLGGLIFNTELPYEAKYACRHCGTLIDHIHKDEMLKTGKWIAEKPNEGRQPSFFINALYSPVSTWDDMVEAYLKAKDDPVKYKSFYNLELGLPWEERGEAPEWERLYERRDDYPMGTCPKGGLVITAGADIQQDGIYYEVVAYGPGKTNWSIDIGFLEGDTADSNNPVWSKLDEVYNRKYQDVYGNHIGIDAFGVDSGYNTNPVYEWTRARPKAYALKGKDGWHRPALGTATYVDVKKDGRTIRRGAKLFAVGTWGLKSSLYSLLRKSRVAESSIPAGYCHFSQFHDQGFFKQLTAEYLTTDKRKDGRKSYSWRASGANHYHDCRIYSMAMYEHLTARWDDKKWEQVALDRNVPHDQVQSDLFAQIQGRAKPTSVPKVKRRRGVLSKGID